jgi:hypothetical protein
LKSRPNKELFVADEDPGASIPDTDGGGVAEHQREAVALVAEAPHAERHGNALNI